MAPKVSSSSKGIRSRALGLGVSTILAQSHVVVAAFGRDRGYKLMVLAILVSALFSLGTLLILARAMARFMW